MAIKPVQSFAVFGEPVDILVSAEMTAGQSTTLIQTSPPGGGPPPHLHQNEDETFFVLEGEYEFLSNGEWGKIDVGQAVHATRGSIHTFRNVGQASGRMLIFVAPGGFEKYLEAVSPFSIPEDLEKVLAISESYGISFPH